ncbi:MAG: hypothetical protein ACXWQO_03995 [Bdellovibrionota bacterium]
MKTLFVLLALSTTSIAHASVSIDGEKYACENGTGNRMVVEVTYNSLRPADHMILKGEKAGRKMVFESQMLGFSVQLQKQNTDKITLVDNTSDDIQDAVYSCKHL